MLDREDYRKILVGGIGYFKDLYLNKDPVKELFDPKELPGTKYNFSQNILYQAAKNPSKH